jgi:surface antigen
MLFLGAFVSCAGPAARLGPNLAAAHRYPGLDCAPFARALTGVALTGNAAVWWEEADGLYQRTRWPAVGAILVLQPSARLPAGHVAVVSRLLDRRRIHVIQANWVPGELDQDQLVVDVSPGGDWGAVRVWYPPTGQLGSHTYPVLGFILPETLLTHDVLWRRAAPAAAAASGS